MAITVRELCKNCENVYGMKLISGFDGLDNYVRWVHLIEDGDVPNFLHGNELVFITGIGQQSSDDSWLVEFVKKLYEKKSVGLVVNIGPYISHISDDVVEFCEENKLALFAVPWSVHLVDIIYDYCHKIVNSEENEISLSNAFKNLIFSLSDSETVCKTLDKKGFKNDDIYSVVTLKLIENTANDFDIKNLQLLLHKSLNEIIDKFSLITQDDLIICIMDGFTPENSETFFDEFINKYSLKNVYVGISPVCNGHSGITESYKKSVSAVKVALINNQNICYYDEIGVYKLLLEVSNTEILKNFAYEQIGILQNFDKKNGSDYLLTLKCYLMNNSSVQEVAKQTFVHRNTINYKIKRIKEILNCDLNYEDKLNLMLAFYISKLLEKSNM